jgi:hypothetical protein
MKKSKYISAKTAGNRTEAIVESWLQELGIQYKQENTMRNTRTRAKGGIDFLGPDIAIEVKRFTDRLEFRILKENRDVKWSQVCILSREHTKGKKAGLLITENNEDFIYIPIGSFLKWLSDTNRKSITFDIGAKIGYIVRDAKDLGRVLEV